MRKLRERSIELHYYEWSIIRWRTCPARELLSAAGRGIYRELLDACYAQGSIPSDPRILQRMSGGTEAEFASAWVVIEGYFPLRKNHPEHRINLHSELYRRQVFATSKANSQAGKKGGSVKSSADNNIESGRLPNRKRSPHIRKRKEIKGKDNTPTVPTPPDGGEGRAGGDRFAEFWEVVWSRIGRGAAEKAWKREAKTAALEEQIIAAAKEQGPGILRQAREHKHSILHPATWLNQKRYLDEPNEPDRGAPDVPPREPLSDPPPSREKVAERMEYFQGLANEARRDGRYDAADRYQGIADDGRRILSEMEAGAA